MNKGLNHIILFFATTLLLMVGFNRIFGFYLSLGVAVLLGVITSLLFVRRYPSKIKSSQLFVSVVFLSIIFIPFIGPKENESLEKRNLKQFPEWRWTNVWKFFKEYQTYFDDRFTYRNQLIDYHGKIKYDYLAISNLTPEVAIGTNRWLFYSESSYLTRIATPFTDEELKKFNYNLNIITKWFKQRGIDYYLFIPPVKSRIYPEYLPDYMKVRIHFSRYNQLKDYITTRSNANYITCDDELFLAKNTNEIYYKTDTHWNEIGAFVGYSKIIKTIQQEYPQINTFEMEDFKIKKTELFTGDLLAMLGYQTKTPYYQYLVINKNNIKANLTLSTVLPENPTNVFEIFEMPSDTNNLTIYVVRDSYSENLKRFLSLNFKKSIYEWMPDLPVAKIVKEKPTIVFHEMLERFSYQYLELPPEIKADTAFINQFNINDF